MFRKPSILFSRLTSNASLRISSLSTTSSKYNQESSQANKVSDDVDSLFGFDNESSNDHKSSVNEQPERKNKFNIGLEIFLIYFKF